MVDQVDCLIASLIARLDVRSGRLLQRALVVGHELLDSFFCELVLDVDTLPRLIQVDGPVRKGLQGLIGLVGCLVGKICSGEREGCVSPLFPDLSWGCYEFRFCSERTEQVLEIANAGGEHMDVSVSCFVHLLDVFYEIHSVLSAVVETAYEWRDIYRGF